MWVLRGALYDEYLFYDFHDNIILFIKIKL